MNYKQLLALFLFIVMIFSTSIVSMESRKIVKVKDVSNNIDKYTIESITEENDDFNINVFYPVTKCKEVNDKINANINTYIEKLKKESAGKEKKELTISFEDFDNKEYTSFKFNIKRNIGTVHNIKETFTVTYRDNTLVDIEYLSSKNENLIDKLYDECKSQIESDSKIMQYSNDKWIKEGLTKEAKTFDNFILTQNSIVILFNTDTVAPSVAGIIEVEIPYEKISLNLE